MLLSPPPKMQFFGDDGLPLSGGLIYTYEKDTTTPLATYIDSTGSVANSNPIVLDAYGFASIWFQILPYSLVIKDSLGVLQSSSGPIEFSQSATSGSDIAAWSDIVVYNYPDQVAGSDGYTYRCVGTNILDDDPVGSSTGAWVNLSSLASAALTGTPTAPTAAEGTATTQIATCAFAQNAANVAGGRGSGIMGGNVSVSGNTLTITPTSCFDSTKKIWLETTANKTLTIPSVASTTYHIFIVKLVADSSVEFRAYTTEAAVADDTQVSFYRWIYFHKTDVSNNCYNWALIDGEIVCLTPFQVATVSVGGFTAKDMSTIFPLSRTIGITPYCPGSNSSSAISISLDGTNTWDSAGVYGDLHKNIPFIGNGFYTWAAVTARTIYAAKIQIRR